MDMSAVTHRFVETNGIRMHVAEAGSGPLVLLLHGFPESWYSWRHQLSALADAGYHAVAPDQRGYGQTDRPAAVASYTQLHLVGDVVGLIDALGEEQAVVIGHDWGAPIAWNTALLRPDRVRGVVGLSVPYTPRGPVSRLTAVRAVLGEGFYMAYFQAPGVADAELASDVRATMRRFLYSLSGDAPRAGQPHQPVVPAGGGILDILAEPEALPSWLSEADLDFFVAEFERTGFTGGLNWYRTIDLSWELLAPWQGAPVVTPALYVAGDRDLVVSFPGMDALIPRLQTVVPNLRQTVLLPGCGHWTQQERPAEVNTALVEFLHGL
jgi:pimeloyl-ACP methyl ester carboxylesterase